MAKIIKHKRSSAPGYAPAAGALNDGELAINTADGKVYFKKADGTVTDLNAEGLDCGGTPTVLYYRPDINFDRDAADPYAYPAFAWDNLANWFNDSNGTVPSTVFPDKDTIVYINGPLDSMPANPPTVKYLYVSGSVRVVNFSNNGVIATAGVLIQSSAHVTGTIQSAGTITVSGSAWILPGSTLTGNVVVRGDALVRSTSITGSAQFKDTSVCHDVLFSSANSGTISFYNSASSGWYGVGTLTLANGNATFYDSSVNYGKIVVNTNVLTFANQSSNYASGEIVGDAVFNDSAKNYANARAITGAISGNSPFASSTQKNNLTFYFNNTAGNDGAGLISNLDNWYMDYACTQPAPYVPGTIASNLEHIVVVPGATKMAAASTDAFNIASFTAKIYSTDTPNYFYLSANVYAAHSFLLEGNHVFSANTTDNVYPSWSAGSHIRLVNISASLSVYFGSTTVVCHNSSMVGSNFTTSGSVILTGSTILSFVQNYDGNFGQWGVYGVGGTFSLYNTAKLTSSWGSHVDFYNGPGFTLYDSAILENINSTSSFASVLLYHNSQCQGMTISGTGYYVFNLADSAIASACTIYRNCAVFGRAKLLNSTVNIQDAYEPSGLYLGDFAKIENCAIPRPNDGPAYAGGVGTAVRVASKNVVVSGGNISHTDGSGAPSGVVLEVGYACSGNELMARVAHFSVAPGGSPYPVSPQWLLPSAIGSNGITFSGISITTDTLNVLIYYDLQFYDTNTFLNALMSSPSNKKPLTFVNASVSGLNSNLTQVTNNYTFNNSSNSANIETTGGSDERIIFTNNDAYNTGTITINSAYYNDFAIAFTDGAVNSGTIINNYPNLYDNDSHILFGKNASNAGGIITLNNASKVRFENELRNTNGVISFNYSDGYIEFVEVGDLYLTDAIGGGVFGTITETATTGSRVLRLISTGDPSLTSHVHRIIVYKSNENAAGGVWNFSPLTLIESDKRLIMSFDGYAKLETSIAFNLNVGPVNLIFTGNSVLNSGVTASITGAGSSGTAQFSGYAALNGTISDPGNMLGNIIFKDNATLSGLAYTGSIIYFYNSSTLMMGGTADVSSFGGTVYFNDASNNYGTVIGSYICTTTGQCI